MRNQRRRNSHLMMAAAWTAVVVSLPSMGFAQTHQTIDELVYGTAIDNSLFSSGANIETRSGISLGKLGSVQISSEVGIGTDPLGLVKRDDSISRINPYINEDLVDSFSSSESGPLVVKRISASLVNESGILTVGSDWTNFKDVLGPDQSFHFDSDEDDQVFRQIKWVSPDGFSIALEEAPQNRLVEGDSLSGSEGRQTASSMILSWQGGSDGRSGEYRVAALGTRLDAANSGQQLDARDVSGWGLKLEGGWQIGDLFAALSVTYGKGINRYVLKRNDNELLVTASADADLFDAYSIRPSLYYSLNENSHFHVALGHHALEDASEVSGQDTLDTIHMGYNWSPWPSTLFGIELVGENSNGVQSDQNKTRLRFGARTKF